MNPDKDAYGQSVDRGVEKRGDGEYGDYDSDIEKDRRERGHAEVPVGVQDTHGDGHHPDKDHVREHQPREPYRDGELLRVIGKPGRHEPDYLVGKDYAEGGKDD